VYSPHLNYTLLVFVYSICYLFDSLCNMLTRSSKLQNETRLRLITSHISNIYSMLQYEGLVSNYIITTNYHPDLPLLNPKLVPIIFTYSSYSINSETPITQAP
jgi:hypothetical protein